ncbi:mediator of RNA polymerase II transcription subunit 1 isoform X2 [Boleophthalmus pectinirostris]|uniref:mediator of RNA polymerase II transcription subunit 1 isoform X2 n=1 Tax=Boleophthalmus pectinirostris TaxID=150288 RepID=UPI00243185DB|nr:mediator of RNA polymerase II transcription subunit 1 isoform X2 [Boleophthalmus pectinirostris]
MEIGGLASGRPFTKKEMESIISGLHSKFSAKSWNETFQLVRRCMDKSRDESKPCEPLMRSMQRLQEVFSVSSINAMKTRLETIAKQQGMGFHVTDGTCYLTADLFYLEVVLLPCGGVEEVRVAPHGEIPVPSESFQQLLRSKDFAKFSKRLGELFSQYNIPGDIELKLKLFESLQAMGKDLEQISRLPRSSADPSSQTDHINNGIVGMVTVGKEDCPLTVQFYASPDLGLTPVSETQVHTAQLTIGLSDVHHRLQVASSISQPPQLNPHGFPMFKSQNEVPSEQVPACFLLKLQPAVAMVSSLWNKLRQITDVPVPDVGLQWAPLPNLLSANGHGVSSDDQDVISTVSVDGRMHTYVFPGEAWEGPAHRGTLVDTVPFTHLSHVPALLKLLRHQCAINSVLMSAITSICLSSELHFEVLPETDTSFTVTFHRPDTVSLAVLVVDVSDCHQLSCRLYGVGLDDPSLEECISTVMKRYHSLPMTLQTLYSNLSERTSPAPHSSPTVITEHPDSDCASPPDASSAMDTDGASNAFSRDAAVSEDRVTPLPAHAAMSVSQSELVPEINPSPPVDPYHLAPMGVFSPWMTSNSQLSELI